MRLKRTITDAEFAEAIQHMRPPSQRVLEIAHADLVRGIGQEEIARKYQITKGSVSQTSKRVWRGFLKSKGYQEVTVVLPEVRAFIVGQWNKQSLDELNQDNKTGENTPPPAS